MKLNKKYVWAFRVLMLVAAMPFIVNVYDAVTLGYIDFGSYSEERGDFGYFANLAKNGAFSFLFLWLGIFGVEAATGSEEDRD